MGRQRRSWPCRHRQPPRAFRRAVRENRAHLVSLFRDHGRVVAEPWQERLLDMSVSFQVGKGGFMSGFRGHALLNSATAPFWA